MSGVVNGRAAAVRAYRAMRLAGKGHDAALAAAQAMGACTLQEAQSWTSAAKSACDAEDEQKAVNE